MKTALSWHSEKADEVLRALETDAVKGLTEQESKERLKIFGPNTLAARRSFRFFAVLWNQVKSPLVFILIIAGVIAFVLGEITDTIVIFLTVLINTAIGFYQEGKASKTFDKLKETISHSATVVRQGYKKIIKAEELVQGDIVILDAGDQIPADIRLLEAKNLQVNESALTGEWAGVSKNTDLYSEKTRITDRYNMVWMGTLVQDGFGKGVVVQTGQNTEFGKIARLVESARSVQTPFQKGVARLARIVGVMVAVAAVLIFVVGLLEGENITTMFLTSVAVAVAAIPEGLPVAVTVVLAIGMSRILRQGGLVKRLVASETLGSTSIILTDKTGTLTEAKMQISDIISADEIFADDKEKQKEYINVSKINILEAGIFTSDAFIENPEDDLAKWKVRGKEMDKALLLAGIQSGISPIKLFKDCPKIDFIAFNPEKRYAASLNKIEGGSRLFVSGAPETILSLCKEIRLQNEIIPLSAERKKELEKTFVEVAERGSRIIAMAFKDGSWNSLPRDGGDIISELVFLGFVAFHDPLRKDVYEAIKKAKKAGLRPVMVTGDHIKTATAVAKALGLLDKGRIVLGDGVEDLNDKAMEEFVQNVDVFARVLPHQKLKIANAWRRLGHVVAMTGDGVNDAPALKTADIGIALGSGTDVAKEAADLVLLKDSFSIIIRAVEEGRVILDNLRKIVTYLLSTGFSEIVLIAGTLILRLPLPVLPKQILWANIVEEGFMNFAFAFEPKEEDVMERDPRKVTSAKIINKEMATIIFGVGIITDILLFTMFFYLLHLDLPIKEIRTFVFVGLSLDAIFYAFALKSLRRPIWKINLFSNKYLMAAFIISVAFLIFALVFPPLRNLLSLTSLHPIEFLLLAGLGVANLLGIELVKWYFISRHKAV